MSSIAPTSTIADTFYLLSVIPEKHRVRDRGMGTPRGIRAALLADLLQQRLIADDGDRPRVTASRTASDPIAEEMRREIAASGPKQWKYWVERKNGQTLRSVEESLASRGIITVERTRILGIFPHYAVTIHDPASVAATVAHLRDEALGSIPVAQIPEIDAVLISLLAAAQNRDVISRGESRHHKTRLAEIELRAGPTGPALKKAIRQMNGIIASSAAGHTG